MEARQIALKGAQDILNEVKKSLAETQSKHDSLAKELDGLNRDTDELKAKTNAMGIKSNELKREMPMLQSKLERAKVTKKIVLSDFNITSKKGRRCAKADGRLKGDCRERRANSKSLQDQVSAGEESIKNAKKEHEELLRRGRKADLEKMRLEVRLALLHKEYQRLAAQNRSLSIPAGSAPQK